MLEFIFGVIVGVLALILYLNLKVKGELADELTLTVAGYTLYIKKLDEGSNERVQKRQLNAKSPSNSRASKYSSKLQQRDESNAKQEGNEQAEKPSPSTSLKPSSLKNNSAPTNLNSPRAAAQSPREAPKEDSREAPRQVQPEAPRQVQPEAPRETPKEEVAPKSPIGTFPGKATPSLYLAPDLGRNRSKQLDVLTGRSASDANLGGVKSPKVANVVQGSGKNSSLYLTPNMQQSDVATAQDEDLGGHEPPQKSPKVVGKASKKTDQSLYLAPTMSNNSRSQQYDLITAKSNSKEDAHR